MKYNKELNLRKETEQQKEQIELQLVSRLFTCPMHDCYHDSVYRKTHKKLLKIKANR